MWNDAAWPAGYATPITSPKAGRLYLTTDALTFTLSSAGSPGPVAYEVRDYYGDIVATGLVTGTTLTLPALRVGWYKLYLLSDVSDANYGLLRGSCCFGVITHDSRLPDPPAKATTRSTVPFDKVDNVLRGVALLGPHRNQISAPDNPAAEVATIQSDLAIQEAWYDGFAPDPQRPRPRWAAFTADTTSTQARRDGVTSAVSTLYGSIPNFEGPTNEPTFTTGTAATVAANMQTFHAAVKAGNASAQVLGPCPVSINGGTLTGLDAFFAAGGGNYIDQITFHVYNVSNGDITLGRKSLEAFVAMLTRHGQHTKPRWQTEWGSFAADWGVFNPRQQCRWSMLQLLLLEQYGVPKERNCLFYDRSHGFWDFPSWWLQNDDSVYPLVLMMRTFSTEVHGKEYAAALDFGTTGNKMYLGNRYEAPDGTTTLALMADGRTDGTITLSASGVSTLTTIDPFGNPSTIPVQRGRATLPVSTDPVYVRAPAGATVEVEGIEWGHNLTRPAARALVPTNPWASDRIINNTWENWYAQDFSPHVWKDTGDLPSTITIDLWQPKQFDTIAIWCPTPWQDESTLLDATAEYQDDNGTWHELATFTETYNWRHAPEKRQSGGGCFYDHFHSGRCVFVAEFTPIRARYVRLVVRDTTNGGVPNATMKAAGGQGSDQRLRIREIEVFSRATQHRTPILAG